MTEWSAMWGEIGWEYYRRMFGAALRGGKYLREYGGRP
jgi:hypothetical protein